VSFWGTTYHIYSASPVAKNGIPFLDPHGTELGPAVSQKDWCFAALEGTVRVGEKTYNFATNASVRQVDCHQFFGPEVGFSRFVIAQGPFGDGVNGFRLVPFRTIATDPHFLALGTVIYVPGARGYRMPDGQLHDGYFFAGDAGGVIKSNHVDFFCGDHPVALPFALSTSRPRFSAYIVRNTDIVAALKAEHS
jgi:3D (Asp-Asp-Asp) domain-containing protein